ncbi:MAG: C/D box methylation guide ribonucleoprotein complex aNOP56 subunit [Candidatus Odinarchaeia archaeon]
MKAYIVEHISGIYCVNDNGDMIEHIAFPKDSDIIAEKVLKIQNSEVIPEHREIIEKIVEKGFLEVILEDKDIVRLLKEDEKLLNLGVRIKFSPVNEATRVFRSKISSVVKSIGFARNWREYVDILQEVCIKLTRVKIKSASEKRDHLIIQAVESLDDLDKTLNLFASRIREWYGLHFPELNQILASHEAFIKIIAKVGLRSSINEEVLKKVVEIPEKQASEITEKAKASMGAEISDEDFKPIWEFANLTLNAYNVRREIEEYIDNAMSNIAPNVKALVGSLLGARLISLAGGLENLSKLPASTIQVLGAEKALFRALKTGSKPPKHGVLFQHPLIHASPWWQRGKIARALAGKLSIAARIDNYSSEDISDNLLASLQQRIDEIKRKYPKPPKKERVKRREKRRVTKKKRK